jgi:hypothetical protein
MADSLRTPFSIQNKNLPPTVSTQLYTDMINRIKLAATQPSDNIIETINNIMSNFIRELAHAEQVAKAAKHRVSMGILTKTTIPPNISEEANAAQVFQPRSFMKDLANGETDGRPFQKYGRSGGKGARFQRQNDHENSDGQRQRTLTKHVGAQYNAGDRRNPEECVFARTEDESIGISCILNKYRDQLTKCHNEDTTKMCDDDSTQVRPVQGSEWESKQTRKSWRRGREPGPSAGPALDIQDRDDIGIAESERELPEIIDHDSDGNIRVSSSIIRKCRCFCNVTSFILNLSVLKRNVCLVRISTADSWNHVAVSLVSFDSTSKGRTHFSVLVIPSFNRS